MRDLTLKQQQEASARSKRHGRPWSSCRNAVGQAELTLKKLSLVHLTAERTRAIEEAEHDIRRALLLLRSADARLVRYYDIGRGLKEMKRMKRLCNCRKEREPQMHWFAHEAGCKALTTKRR